MTARGYVIGALITIGSLLIALTAFNMLIDPFDMFGSPKVEGWNKQKPHVWEWIGYKTSAIREYKPQVLILGTSRTEIGIDPRHKVFDGQNVYNAATSGGSFKEIAQYFDYANKIASPKKVIIGLDFHTFNIYNKGTSDQGVDPFKTESSFADLLNNTKIALSFNTFISSLSTASSQDSSSLRWQPSDKGMINPVILEKRITEYHYQRSLFLHDEKDVITREHFVPYLLHHKPENANDPINLFRRLIKDAYLKNIDVTFFISPAHACYWEVVYNLGLEPKVETWKRMLVAALNEEAGLSGKPTFPLWDFSGYNIITTENIPADKDEKSRMRWYWEPSHYRNEAGNIVLDRMFFNDKTFVGFGVLLTPQNIEQHLKQIKLNRQSYARTNAEEVERIQNRIRSINKNNQSKR